MKEEEDKILVRGIEAMEKRGYKSEYYKEGFVIHIDGDEESRLPDIILEYIKMSLEDGAVIEDILDEDHLLDYLVRRPIQIQELMDDTETEIDWAHVGEEINYTIKLHILLVMVDVEKRKELMKYIGNIMMNAIKVVEEDTSMNALTDDEVWLRFSLLLMIGEIAKTLKVHESGVEREKLMMDIHNAVMSKEVSMRWGEE